MFLSAFKNILFSPIRIASSAHHLRSIKKTSHIIISTGGKLLTVCTPGQPANLLRVHHDPLQQSYGSIGRTGAEGFTYPIPLNRVVVYVSKFVANEKLFRLNHQS